MNDVEQKRLERFGRLHPPTFSGTESEDAQDFLDRCQRMFHTAGILETIRVSFTTFQLTGATFRWWETYTRREELRKQFEYLRQEDLSVTQYEMRFSELSRYVVWLVPTEREKIRRFINGLNHQFRFVMTLGNIAGAKFNGMVYSARRLKMDSSIPSSSGSYFGSHCPPKYLPAFSENASFECGDLGHIKRYCPCLTRGSA
ncbi:uncharacterized protein [Nicotiana tomentosiformis]|uniref:uncharacterized protein n=1 Tax=Nicotiana tomentosiformis TaxID=4098 RepID=UPI00388CCFB5